MGGEDRWPHKSLELVIQEQFFPNYGIGLADIAGLEVTPFRPYRMEYIEDRLRVRELHGDVVEYGSIGWPSCIQVA